MWPALVVSGVCLLLEMFFAAAELSVISADRIALRKDAEAGMRTARAAREASSRTSSASWRPRCSARSSSVIVSTVTMTYALHKVVSPHRAELYLLAALTPLLGHLRRDRAQDDRAAVRPIAGRAGWCIPLWLASKLFAPVVCAADRFSTWLMRALGIAERKLVTREELELLLKAPASRARAARSPRASASMISRIFDFTDTTVDDVMVPLSDVVALAETADLDDVGAARSRTSSTRASRCIASASIASSAPCTRSTSQGGARGAEDRR